MSTYCPHCGASTQDGDAFCPECGGRLNELADTTLVPEEAASVSGQPDALTLIGERPAEPTPSLVPDLSRLTDVPQDGSLTCPVAPKPRANRTVLWIIVGVSVLAILCCCCLAGFMLLSWSGASGNLSLVELLRGFGIR